MADFTDFIEVSRANLDKIPGNIFITDEPDPEKAIPAILAAIHNGAALAGIWLQDYWEKDRDMFRALAQDGPVKVEYSRHRYGGQDLTAAFNDASGQAAQDLIARMRQRQQTLEQILLRHFEPAFLGYYINGGKGEDSFNVKDRPKFHVDQSKYFALAFLGAISGPGTWFAAQNDTAYYRGNYSNGKHDEGEMTQAWCVNQKPVIYGVPEGALLVMPCGDAGPHQGKALLHTTPFALITNEHSYAENDMRILERFTVSAPDYRGAVKAHTL